MDAQIYEMEYKELKCNKNSYKNSRDIFYTKCLFLFDCNMPFSTRKHLLAGAIADDDHTLFYINVRHITIHEH